MSDWAECIDPKSGKAYYHKKSTGETSWQKPPDYKAPGDLPDWVEVYDHTHKRLYYHNKATGETSWEKPQAKVRSLRRDSIIPKAPSSPSISGRNNEAPALSPEWEQHWNSEHARNYYVHKKTGETRWEMPTANNDAPTQQTAPPIPDASKIPSPFDVSAIPPPIVTGGIPPPISNATNVPPPIVSTLPPPALDVQPQTEGIPQIDLPSPELQPPQMSVPSMQPPSLDPPPQIQSQRGPDPAVEEGPAPERHLPEAVQEELHKFQMKDFAKKHFRKQSKSIFRRTIPMEELIHFQKDVLSKPLMNIKANLHKDAGNAFKLLLGYQEEKAGTKGDCSFLARRFIQRGIDSVDIRDELYVQLIKQSTECETVHQLQKALELIGLTSQCFTPSKDLEDYVLTHLKKLKTHEDDDVTALARYAYNQFTKASISGGTGKVPSDADINNIRANSLAPYVYGAHLGDLRERWPDQPVPQFLETLAESIVKSGGLTTQGVFRVPGDTDEMDYLRKQIDGGDYSLPSWTVPHVPASLLKLFLRELAEPLFPNSMYSRCIASADDAAASLALMGELPECNRSVAEWMIRLLQRFGAPEIAAVTSMNLDNLAMVFAPGFVRCPSKNPSVILDNQRKEQDFVLNLLSNY